MIRSVPNVARILLGTVIAGILGICVAQRIPNHSSEIEAARNYIEAGNAPAAEKLLRTLASQRPKDAVVHYLLGVALSQTENYDGSNRALQTAVQLDPGLALAY